MHAPRTTGGVNGYDLQNVFVAGGSRGRMITTLLVDKLLAFALLLGDAVVSGSPYFPATPSVA